LTRLVLAWVLVALWFVVATIGSIALVGFLLKPPGQGALWLGLDQRLFKWRLVEAGLLTLFASLWFDSLGSGQWWLVFLLVGALSTIPTWLVFQPNNGRPPRVLLVGASADLVRYLLAGAILAWRLG
jgi:hypothetical protein